MSLRKLNIESKDNDIIINKELTNNSEIISLKRVKIVLKRSLMDFEDKMKEQMNDEYFDVYDYIRDLGEGFAEATVRRYLNTTTNDFFKPTQLVILCRNIKDKRPLIANADYLINVGRDL